MSLGNNFCFFFTFQFCQPLGWALSNELLEPQFFVSVLTDIDANRHYCACLCFNEPVAITANKPIDEEEDDNLVSPNRTLMNPAVAIAAAGSAVVNNSSLPQITSSALSLIQDATSKIMSNITHHSIMYAPKCLVLVSRLDYTETFRVSHYLKKINRRKIVSITDNFDFFLQNCLGTIYTAFIEGLNYPLETLIGNILGCIQVNY